MAGPVPTWVYARNGESRIIDLEPGSPPPDGWAFSPAPVADSPELDEPSEAFSSESDDRAALMAEAAGLGVRVDGRWSTARLRQAIDDAQGV